MAGPSNDAMFAEVYDRLKAMAGSRRAGAHPVSLHTTEIVHEAWLRMRSANAEGFPAPAQFFAYAARAMRHILVDAARGRAMLKAGGDMKRLSLTDPQAEAVSIDPLLALELDAGLEALERSHPRAASVLELHYFAGLPLDKVAELVGIGERTANRDWRYARAFLSTLATG